jgi:hypothetical protein
MLLPSLRTLAAGFVVPAALGLSAPVLTGCGSGNGSTSTETTVTSTDAPGGHEEHGEEHDHPSEGPHGGQILEFGSADYHAELVDDDASAGVTIYILDSGATAAAPVATEELVINVRKDGSAKQYRLKANPDAGDTEGKSSRFTADDPALHEDLHSAKEARLVMKVEGKSYNAAIDAHSHDHEGHDHSS